MAFRRGFKSQCERRSVEFRKDLGLAQDQPLAAAKLAKLLQVTVWATTDVEGLSPEDLNVLNSYTDDSWSAFTMRLGTHNLIVYKDGVSDPRINSVVMHEIAHITLGHELAVACILEDGSLVPSNFSQDQEDEANWFAGALLLPRAALMNIRRKRLSTTEACKRYLVSEDMFNWRIRMTGIDYQFGRTIRRPGG
jgi:Zn-dependent peptidase ImmA (M78 family)